MTDEQKHAVGRALRTAFFAARRAGDDEEARALHVAAGELGLQSYVPAGAFLADLETVK